MKPRFLWMSLGFWMGVSSLQASFIKPQEEPKERTPRLILAIDGGGIRGVLPARVLCWLEEELSHELHKRHPQAPLEEIRLGACFDLMAGTSTGGILVLGSRVEDPHTHRLSYSAQTFLKLYEEEGEKIFPSKGPSGFLSGWTHVKYDPRPLETLLEKYFGSQKLSDLKKPTLVTGYHLHQEELVLFKSHRSLKESCLPSDTYALKDVARATSAAPTYLPAATIQNEKGKASTFIDGGVTANNPTLLAYLEAQTLYPGAPFHVISLGCGEASLFLPESKEKGGKLQWAGDIASVLLNSSSRLVHAEMVKAAALRGDRYTRVQFSLDQKVQELDLATPSNLKQLEGYALREIGNPSSPVHEVKKALLSFYEARGFYLWFSLIEDLQGPLRQNPRVLDVSHRLLNDRAFWELHHFLTHQPFPETKGEDEEEEDPSSWAQGIHTISLKGTPLSPSVLTYLQDFGALTDLDLSETSLTGEGLRYLKKALGKESGQGSALKKLRLLKNSALSQMELRELQFLLSPYAHLELDPEVSRGLGMLAEHTKEWEKAAFFTI